MAEIPERARSVAILEPDRQVAELLRTIVRRLGYEVAPKSCEGADLLLLEPGFPGELELAERLRSRRPGLPILCLSVEPPFARSCALAPVAHLMKPVSVAELETEIVLALKVKPVRRRRSKLNGTKGSPSR